MYNNVYSILFLLWKFSYAIKFDPLSDEFIDYINIQGKWTAGRNFHKDTPISYIENLLGAKMSDSKFMNLQRMTYDAEFIAHLPKNFDAREHWPNCPSLKEIRDQGSCGSCWAFGAVECMTDRVCTYSNGSKNFHFSAEDLVTCGARAGCGGAHSKDGWKFWVEKGLVSGGNYGSNEGCRPYSIPPREHHKKGKLSKCTKSKCTPECVEKCQNGYNVSYVSDRRHGKNVYVIENEDNVKAELYKNGPVEATFRVFTDFLHYKSGVYHQMFGKKHGKHAVKILGWGEEDGVKYWLAANSWNTHFGLDGFFKIKRGSDECGIESRGMIAGEPVLEEY